MIWLAIVLAVLLAPAGIALYRHLFGLRLDARSALAQIEEQMHRRHALLQRLIEEAPDDEREKLREAAQEPADSSVKAKAQSERTLRTHLRAALGKLEHIEGNLLDDLERTRLKIDFAARFYNDVVERFNRRWSRLPGIRSRETFDIDDPAEDRID